MTRLVMGSLCAAMRMTMTTNPSRKFMNAPAAMMRARCQTAASFSGLPTGCAGASSFPAPPSGEPSASAHEGGVWGSASGRSPFSACWLSGLSSPSSATNPPTGSARRLYWVPFCVFLSRTGPMPMENSLTCTPQSLATAKWPNSWMAITALNTSTAAKRVMIKDIASPKMNS